MKPITFRTALQELIDSKQKGASNMTQKWSTKKFDDAQIVVLNNNQTLVCTCTGDKRDANAALIAKAPALLAERDRLLVVTKELREINREMVGILERIVYLPIPPGDTSWVTLAGIITTAKTALAKAEKEEK